MANAWDHLPNAKHIDAVLAHGSQHPDRWPNARSDVYGASYNEDWVVAWCAARSSGWSTSRGGAWDAAVYGAARSAARGPCAALVAWDDAGLMLGLPADAVRLFAGVGNHAAILMLPAVLAMNGEKHVDS